jgi:pimeloyl-ACP methyl ester carboxylesterase
MANNSRRTFITQAGIGSLGAIAAPAAFAQSAAKAPLWSQEYWAQKGDVKLYMFRKRKSAPKAAEKPLPVLLLVHGSSLSGRPTFDLTVPGKGEYSLMNVFAGYGFDVWTLDFEGYGRSTRTEGNANIAEGVKDLKAATCRDRSARRKTASNTKRGS